MKKYYAEKLIQKNEEAYNLVSEHFSQTRSFLWSGLLQFKNYVKNKDIVLDFGCGNGRLLDVFSSKEINYFGLDISSSLLKEAKKRLEIKKINNSNIKFINIKSLKVPFKDEYFDSVFSIAVLHHVPSRKFRLKILKEFYRVLKPNGKVIITNWNLWQGKYLNLIFKYAILKFLGQSQMDFSDIMIPWKNQKGEILAKRYYHAFTKRELINLILISGFKIEKIGYFGGKNKKANLYIVAKKI